MKLPPLINCLGFITTLFIAAIFSYEIRDQQSSYTYDPPGIQTAVIGTNSAAQSITTQPQSALLYSNNPVALQAII
jgi:hypothetical protein